MTRARRTDYILAATVIAIWAGVLAVGLRSPAAPPRATIRPLDQPRCFPEGTVGIERFVACIDNRPTTGAA